MSLRLGPDARRGGAQISLCVIDIDRAQAIPFVFLIHTNWPARKTARELDKFSGAQIGNAAAALPAGAAVCVRTRIVEKKERDRTWALFAPPSGPLPVRAGLALGAPRSGGPARWPVHLAPQCNT